MSLDITLLEDCTKKAKCPHCGTEVTVQVGTIKVYTTNITHNLGDMAQAAGIYEALWHPERVGIKTAHDLAVAIEPGIMDMNSNPQKYKKYDAPNGWGTYIQFIPWLYELLVACKKHPNARVEAYV